MRSLLAQLKRLIGGGQPSSLDDLPTGELVKRLLAGIVASFRGYEVNQGELLIALSYTPKDRMKLADELASRFLRDGVEGVSSRDLARYMSEGEIGAVVYNLLSGDSDGSATKKIMPQMLQRPAFRKRVKGESEQSDAIRRPTTRHLGSGPSRPAASADTQQSQVSVSEVQPVSRVRSARAGRSRLPRREDLDRDNAGAVPGS